MYVYFKKYSHFVVPISQTVPGALQFVHPFTFSRFWLIPSQEKLLAAFDYCLKDDGEVLLAAKVHYFGVGGGLRQFECAVRSSGKWRMEVVEKIDAAVKREIVSIRRQKRAE